MFEAALWLRPTSTIMTTPIIGGTSVPYGQAGISWPVCYTGNMNPYFIACSVVELGRVDAGTASGRCIIAATNSQWVFQTSVDVTLSLSLY